MKHHIIAALLPLAVACALTACSDAGKLAEEAEGVWAGNPERIIDTEVSTASLMETYTLVGSDTLKNGGHVDIAALVSLQGAIDATAGFNRQLSVTAAGYATVSGTWQAVSDERIRLHLDPATLTVRVDPDGVTLNTSMITGADIPDLDSIKPQMARSVSAELTRVMQARYPAELTLDDVEVDNHGQTLEFKRNGAEVKLHRQPL